MEVLHHFLTTFPNKLWSFILLITTLQLFGLRRLWKIIFLLITIFPQRFLTNYFISVVNLFELSQLLVKVDNFIKLLRTLNRNGLSLGISLEHLYPVLDLFDLIEQNLPLELRLLPLLCLLLRCL